jgi:hypothetical protein
VQQVPRLVVGQVVQQAEQQHRVDRRDLREVLLAEHLRPERRAVAAVPPAGVRDVALGGVEAEVGDLRQPVEVVRRPAADVDDRVAVAQVELVEAAVAQPVGAERLLQADVQRDVSEQGFEHVLPLLGRPVGAHQQ